MSTRKALFLGCSLQMFQQICGINTIMYYSAKIISMGGVSSAAEAIWLSAAVAAVNFFCTFIGMGLIDKIGRRMLLLISMAGIIFSLVMVGVGFQVSSNFAQEVSFVESADAGSECSGLPNCLGCVRSEQCGFCYYDGDKLNGTCKLISPNSSHFAKSGICSENQESGNPVFATDHCPTPFAWLIVCGLCSYIFFFAPGMGPIPWTVNSEIYPLWARSTCNSIATSTNWGFNFIVSMTFLSLMKTMTEQVLL